MHASKRESDGVRSGDSKTVSVEWTIAEDDQAWELAQAAALSVAPAAPASARGWPRRWWGAAAAALLLLLATGGWLWHQAHVGLDLIEGELQSAVVAEQWVAEQEQRVADQRNGVQQEIANLEPQPENTQVELLDLGEDWALVRVTTKRGESSFRQTRFLRRDANGWSVAAPRATYWGEARTLESAHFVFHYHARDADAVTEAAARLDALYPEVAASYPLDAARDGKQRVRVSPEHPVEGTLDRGFEGSLEVISPALSLAPTELREGELLAQAVLLEVLDALEDQSLEPYLRDAFYYGETVAHVNDLLESLNLWQVWSVDLPLAALYPPTVQWIAGTGQGERGLPSYDANLCALHSLWKAAPYAVQVPLFCGDPQQVMRYEVGRYLPSALPRSLAAIHLFAMTSPDEPARGMLEAERVGLATLLDYAAMTYGRQSLATLIANVALYPSWETLIPATFGVSAREFEAGWQAHLAAVGSVEP